VVVFDTHAVNPALIPNLPYDTVNDFAPVMLVGTAPMAIVTNVANPYRTFGDVIRTAKAKPEALSIGSVGNGSLGHLAMILLQQAGGFKVTHVPYKGGGPMMTDAMGGQIDLGIASVYSGLVKNAPLRKKVFSMLEEEFLRSRRMILRVTGQRELLGRNRVLLILAQCDDFFQSFLQQRRHKSILSADAAPYEIYAAVLRTPTDYRISRRRGAVDNRPLCL